MKKIFRLYNNLNSSFFDLIDGDKETQQTKGLGLLLAKSETALKNLLSIEKIHSKFGKINLTQIDQVIVNSELVSNLDTKYRADILIRLYLSNQPVKAIIIEAKSLNKNISAKSAAIQLENYLSKEAFKELQEFNPKDIFAITLTKYPAYLQQTNIISITWSDIIEKFYYSDKTEDSLLNDYFKFITNIRGSMKFYEKEVFSIPTADWSSNAINKFYVYECPNSGKYLIKNKPLYLTFRKSGGGEMENLYKIEEIILLNFKEELKAFLEDESYSIEIRQRVNNYVLFMQKNKIWGSTLPDDEKQVFILSEKTIKLPHKPKPQKNNSFRAYYDLADLLNQEKKIV